MLANWNTNDEGNWGPPGNVPIKVFDGSKSGGIKLRDYWRLRATRCESKCTTNAFELTRSSFDVGITFGWMTLAWTYLPFWPEIDQKVMRIPYKVICSKKHSMNCKSNLEAHEIILPQFEWEKKSPNRPPRKARRRTHVLWYFCSVWLGSPTGKSSINHRGAQRASPVAVRLYSREIASFSGRGGGGFREGGACELQIFSFLLPV